MGTRTGRRLVWRCLALGLLGGALLLVRQTALRPTSAGLSVPEAVREPAFLKAAEESEDLDRDHLDDALEDRLAERFAPIVFHGERETTFPTSVDSWLERTHLGVVGDPSGVTRQVRPGPLRQSQLIGLTASISGTTMSSTGTRSRGKNVSFVLENVPRDGPVPLNPRDWVTYVHSYPNDAGGITLQYWRAYMRNDATFLGLDVGHGGDWEAITVHLNSSLAPFKTTFLDHSGIVDWGESVRWEGTHALVWSEEGGHSSHADERHSRSIRWVRQETWAGGAVTRWDGADLGQSGGLRNVGEKSRPRNDQVFIQYSGLWGSTGRLFMTSGYWGPAFNETDATCEDGVFAYKPYMRRRAESPECGSIFMKAWCDGADAGRLDLSAECQAPSQTQ